MASDDQIDRAAWAALVQSVLDRDFSGNQTRLAPAVGVTPKTIGRWLRQENAVSEGNVREFARRLDRDPLDTLVMVGYITPDEAMRRRDHRMFTKLGEYLWRRMAMVGMRQQDELGEACDLSERVVADLIYEVGYEPSDEVVRKLASGLAVSRAEIERAITESATVSAPAEPADELLREANGMLDPNSPLTDAERDQIRRILNVAIDPHRFKMEERKIS